MKKSGVRVCLVATLLLLAAAPAAANQATRCWLTYDLEGWSVVYKQMRGSGKIKCQNGQSAEVRIATHGGGVTFGVQSVKGGSGRFSGTFDIADLYGTYVEVGGHAGVGEGASVDARAMFKGNKRLSLAGNGGGWNLGFEFAGFTIRPK